MRKIVKNKSQRELTVVGIALQPGDEIEIFPAYWLKILDDEYLLSLVASGDIEVGNGDESFSAAQGLSHLRSFQEDTFSENFSYRKITSGRSVRIPEDRQMIVFHELEMEVGSELVIEGEVVIL